MYLTDQYKKPGAICKKCHDLPVIYCNFCYCPLYDLKECGGNYKLLKNNIKDCSDCTIPHTKEFVDMWLAKGQQAATHDERMSVYDN